jgi:hypothetical protein
MDAQSFRSGRAGQGASEIQALHARTCTAGRRKHPSRWIKQTIHIIITYSIYDLTYVRALWTADFFLTIALPRFQL